MACPLKSFCSLNVIFGPEKDASCLVGDGVSCVRLRLPGNFLPFIKDFTSVILVDFVCHAMSLCSLIWKRAMLVLEQTALLEKTLALALLYSAITLFHLDWDVRLVGDLTIVELLS